MHQLTGWCLVFFNNMYRTPVFGCIAVISCTYLFWHLRPFPHAHDKIWLAKLATW
jgi:hypothetical protein